MIYQWPATVLTDLDNQIYESISPMHLAVDAIANKIYITHTGTPGYVTAVDGAEERPGHDPVDHHGLINVGNGPTVIAVDSASHRLFIATTLVAGGGHDTAAIMVKTPSDDPPLAPLIDAGANDDIQYRVLAFNPISGKLYAYGFNGATGAQEVKVIEAVAGASPYAIPKHIGGFSSDLYSLYLALDAVQNRVYVTSVAGDGASVLRTMTDDVLDAAFDAAQTVDHGPIAFDFTTHKVFVATLSNLTGNYLGGVIATWEDGPDLLAPTFSSAAPADGSSFSALLLTQGSVQVSDERSDVTAVQVSLRDAQGEYWSGTQWVAGSEIFSMPLRPWRGAIGGPTRCPRASRAWRGEDTRCTRRLLIPPAIWARRRRSFESLFPVHLPLRRRFPPSRRPPAPSRSR